MTFSDPLGYGVELGIRAQYYPLGFPLKLATNSAAVSAAAQASWSRFAPSFETEPLELRVVVEAGEELPPEPVARAQGHLLSIVSDARNVAILDLARGFAFCLLSEAAARDAEFASYHFLEAIAYCALCHAHLTPVHAALIARDGRGVLLSGDAGAGKSSLAYACARRGWTFLSENTGWIVRGQDDLMVLGDPHQIRFREPAVALFPELASLEPRKTAAGKLARVLDLARTPELRSAFRCRPASVIFLNRHAGNPARLLPVGPADALDRLAGALPMFEPRVQEEHRRSLCRLAQLPVYELLYGTIESAVNELDRLAPEL